MAQNREPEDTHELYFRGILHRLESYTRARYQAYLFGAAKDYFNLLFRNRQDSSSCVILFQLVNH